jgi:hypothetical protein
LESLNDDQFVRKYGKKPPSFVYKDDVNYNDFGKPEYTAGGSDFVIESMPTASSDGKARFIKNKGRKRVARDKGEDDPKAPDEDDGILDLKPTVRTGTPLRIIVTDTCLKKGRAGGHVYFRLARSASPYERRSHIPERN